jgi:hypothetical protein
LSVDAGRAVEQAIGTGSDLLDRAERSSPEAA